MTSDDKTRIQPAMAQVSVGTQLSGIYELDAWLGSGGMAEVYRGHNIQTGDLVAIKIVLPEYARDETILSLFRKEASILNHLSHDAVVRYHVFTVDPGIARPYLAMEFVNGQSLSDVLRNGPMPVRDVQKLCLRLAAGLAAVHEAHVYHRDLSPDNIILPEGRVDRAKIIDFGIARSAAVGEGTLIGGRFAGKYSYVSPEQLGLFGGEVAEQSDIYSLGLVLAAALRGKQLDMGGSQWEVVEKRRSVPEIAGIDDEMRPMIEAMLQPDPRHRPASMDQVMTMVRASQAPGDPQTLRPGTSATGFHEIDDHRDRFSENAADRPRFVEHVPPSIPGRQQPSASGVKKSTRAPRSARPGTVTIAATAAIVLLLAGGGIYFLIGRPSEVPTTTPDANETADEIAVAAPPQTPPPTPAPTDGAIEQTAMPPVPEASNQEQTPATTEPSTPEAESPPEIAVENATRPIEEALIELLRDQALPETEADAATGEPDRRAADERPASPPITEPPAPAPVPQPEPEIAALPPADPLPAPHPPRPFADRVAWLRDFPGGNCFYTRVLSSTETSADIEGYGTDISRFETLLAEFEARFGIEPDIHVRPISAAQCAVTDFLQALDGDSNAPGLTLARTSLSAGQPLSGRVEMSDEQAVSLLLVDHEGSIFNLDRFMPSGGSSGTFEIPITADAGAAPRPQVLLAIAAPSKIEAASFQSPSAARTVLPAIAEEIRSRSMPASATAIYFRIGG